MFAPFRVKCDQHKVILSSKALSFPEVHVVNITESVASLSWLFVVALVRQLRLPIVACVVVFQDILDALLAVS